MILFLMLSPDQNVLAGYMLVPIVSASSTVEEVICVSTALRTLRCPIAKQSSCKDVPTVDQRMVVLSISQVVGVPGHRDHPDQQPVHFTQASPSEHSPRDTSI